MRSVWAWCQTGSVIHQRLWSLCYFSPGQRPDRTVGLFSTSHNWQQRTQRWKRKLLSVFNWNIFFGIFLNMFSKDERDSTMSALKSDVTFPINTLINSSLHIWILSLDWWDAEKNDGKHLRCLKLCAYRVLHLYHCFKSLKTSNSCITHSCELLLHSLMYHKWHNI